MRVSEVMDRQVQTLRAGTPIVELAERPRRNDPDETLHDAAMRMVRRGVGRLPVVSRGHRGLLLGYVGRHEVLNARLRRLEDEHVHGPGWIEGATSE